MKRFRVTLLALSLVLLFLGIADLRTYMKNRQPQNVSIAELVAGVEHIERMNISGGYFDLLNAINTSGSIEIDALLVPLTVTPGEQPFKVFVETRNPDVLTLVTQYNLGMDTEEQRAKFLEDNKEKFYPQMDLAVMQFSNIVANSNQAKLVKLVESVGLKVDENVLFVSEGKEPPLLRGIFFFLFGILGVLKAVSMFKKARQEAMASM